MKLALLIMLLAGSMFQAQQEHSPPLTQEEPKLCTISGRVVKRATGEPLKSARLLLSENVAGEGHEYAAFTDANGQFVIKNVVPGRYDFEAHHNGYVEQDYQPEGAHSSTVLDLAPGQKLDKVLFRLTAAAAVVGRITDEDGEPAPAIVVQALAEESNGTRKILDPVARALTDDLGRYRLFGLSPGEYYFNTVDPGTPNLSPMDFTIKHVTQNSVLTRHPSTYYPGVLRSDQAQKVTLHEGEELHLDLGLRQAKTFTVAGVVVGPSGNPAAAVEVYLRDRNESESVNFVLPPDTARTDAKGRFQIINVLPADYSVSAAVQEKDKWYAAEQQIDLASEDITNIRLVLKSPVSVVGRIMAQGSSDFVFHNLWVTAFPVTENVDALLRGGPIQEDGSFKFDTFEATYGLHIQAMPEGWYLSSARLNGEDVLQHGMKIDSAGSQKLELRISHTSARLEGAVLLGDKPAVGAHLRLTPVHENPYRRDLVKGADTDQNGNFILTSIVPGTYKLSARLGEDETKNDSANRGETEVTVGLTENEIRTIKLKIDDK